MTNNSIAHLSDRELLETTARAASDERGAVVELLILLGEIDARRLYLPEGCSSLFTYCTHVLKFSEHEAYHRIEAARVARTFPIVLDGLRDGALTLSSITLLRPHLTSDTANALIANARHKSKREVEQQMVALAPKPDAKSIIRRLPQVKPVAMRQEASATTTPLVMEPANWPDPPVPHSSLPRPISAPLSPGRYLLRVTLSADAHAKLKRAQDLLRHSDPSGDPATVIDRALTLLVDDLERRRLAQVRKPRLTKPTSTNEGADRSSRHIPATVRREVWARDAGRCAFVGRKARCRETGHLEFHHIDAYALGGDATVANLELRCRAHNQYEGALLFGPRSMGVDADVRTRPGPS